MEKTVDLDLLSMWTYSKLCAVVKAAVTQSLTTVQPPLMRKFYSTAAQRGITSQSLSWTNHDASIPQTEEGFVIGCHVMLRSHFGQLTHI